MKGLIIYFIIFILFSFLGYIYETVLTRLIYKKWVNKGFFHGSILPMYGFIALIIIYLLKGYYNDLIIVAVFSSIIGLIIKYFTSYVLEKIFYYRFWDLSNIKYNIKGIISVIDAIVFSIYGIFIIYFFEPIFLYLLNLIPYKILIYISIIILIIIIIDLVISIIDAKRTCKIAYSLEIILNEYTKSKNIKLNKIKLRLFKAFPYILNNNRLYQRLEKLKKDFIKEKKKSRSNHAKYSIEK